MMDVAGERNMCDSRDRPKLYAVDPQVKPTHPDCYHGGRKPPRDSGRGRSWTVKAALRAHFVRLARLVIKPEVLFLDQFRKS